MVLKKPKKLRRNQSTSLRNFVKLIEVLRIFYATSMSDTRNDRRIRQKKTANRQKNNNECYVVTQTYLKAFD